MEDIKPTTSAVNVTQALTEARKLVQELEQKQQTGDTSGLPSEVKLTTEVVLNINEPARHPDFGDAPYDAGAEPTHCYITYVDRNNQRRTSRCSAEIFRWQRAVNPWSDVHAEWIFHKDPAGQIVTVIRKPILRQGPLAARSNASPYDLVVQKTGNVYEPVTLPANYTAEILQEALDAMNNAGRVSAGNTVGRFQVKQIQADEQLTVVVLTLKD